MRRKILSAFALALCLSALSCHSTMSGPPSETLKLGQLAGKWKSTSHSLAATINGLSEDAERTFECKWTLDKYYLTCLQLGEMDGKPVREVDLFTYSESAKLYSMAVVTDIGDNPPQVFTNWFAWDKDTWRFLPRNGVRSTWEFKSPDYHTTLTERSTDGGTWTEIVRGEHHRVF
jgi:hypothetical protein